VFVGPIPSKDSDADVFPLADLAPYEPGNHSWNPNGTGNIWRKFDIPVIQLSNEAASRASTGAVANAIQVLAPLLQSMHGLPAAQGDCMRGKATR
jgi:hypothetical protein